MKPFEGTPKTLRQAIQNGILTTINTEGNEHHVLGTSRIIELHVRDFLAQKFGVATMQSVLGPESDRLEKLWQSIIKKEAP